MSTLEDMLPELAGVFAAQESAMENVVSMLTTQVAQLIQANDEQSRQMASLEASQQQLQDALLVLRTAYDSLAAQHTAAETSHSDAVSAISASMEALQRQFHEQVEATETKWHSVESRLEAAVAGPSESQVTDLVSSHMCDIESKLAAHMEHRLLETLNRSYLQSQQVEEAMKSDLEVLEKKFEYLSRVKMEIKDVYRKIEKQDQTIDDMRMGIELLTKSIGADDASDSGDDDDDNDRKQLLCDNQTDVMKCISMSSAEIQAKIDENASFLARLSAAASAPLEVMTAREHYSVRDTTDVRLVRSKSVPAVPSDKAGFVQSKTLTSRSEGQAVDTDVFEMPPRSDVDSDGDAATSDDLSDAVSDSSTPRDASPRVESIAAEAPEDAVEATEIDDEPSVEVPPVDEPPTFEVVEAEPAPIEQEQLQPDESTVESVEEPSDVASERSPEEDDSALEQAEESDRVVDILPSTSLRSQLVSLPELPPSDDVVVAESRSARPTSATAPIQHMATAPNLATLFPGMNNASTAMIRSRKATRLLKRTNSVKRDSVDSSRSDVHAPLSKDAIKELWQRMFARFVQLKRLQILSGASLDRIFRKQNLSVGARVKRLEEASTDLEELVDVLERSIETSVQSVQTLDQRLAQAQSDTDARIDKLCNERQAQGQMLVGLDEKLDLIELDLRRVRGAARRDSSQTIASSALTSQQHELAAKLYSHTVALEALEQSVKRLTELEVPALSSKFEAALLAVRSDIDRKSKALALELQQSVERAFDLQAASETRLLQRTNLLAVRLYRDVAQLSKTQLVALEMVRSAKTQAHPPATSSATTKRITLVNVGLEMLQHTFRRFQDDCRSSAALVQPADGLGDDDTSDTRDTAMRSVLLERSSAFLDELERLKEQAAHARRSSISALQDGDMSSAASSSSSFTDRLMMVTTAQLRALEALLPANDYASSNNRSNIPDDSDATDARSQVSDVLFEIQDLVVQVRAVLALLYLHDELLDPYARLALVLSAQDALQTHVHTHDFSIAQLSAAGASVKLMGTRLDAFLDMSFTFAKDDDVKKAIDEMRSASDGVRDSLVQQLEVTQTEAQQHDERLERELTQLVARVNRKLDKDELLWTQEVIERQLQSVAKSSLGEADLADIHRLLRGKLDASYFNALLLEQRNRAAAASQNNGSGVPGNVPLVGAKCISCNNELPPTKAMIKSVVKDQVQQEVAKTLARHGPGNSSTATGLSSPAFNASTHRSLEKYKRELLAATATQQHKPQARK